MKLYKQPEFYFKDSFSSSKMPNWSCPHCCKHNLLLNEEDLIYQETKSSEEARRKGYIDLSEAEYYFNAVFKCSSCNGAVFSSGVGQHSEYSSDDGLSNIDEVEFSPRYFYPTIRLYDIPKKCPESVSEVIIDSFDLAWSNIPAAANRLRVAIERLILCIEPDLDVKKHKTLHSKIENIRGSHSNICQMLMAIKWIGNDGSHDEDVREWELGFAYKAMIHVLDNLYGEGNLITECSEQINKQRTKNK